jgi:hypothetical protein
MFAGMLSDARFGVRQFRKNPRFFALLLAILVLGLGATTAMFAIPRRCCCARCLFPNRSNCWRCGGSTWC